MSQLEDFFAQGVADQMAVMGSKVKIKTMPKGAMSKEFTAAVTSRDGTLQMEYGGALYTVHAHALIPTSEGITPKVSDHLISGNETFIIVSVVRSIIDRAYSCDLVKIQS